MKEIKRFKGGSLSATSLMECDGEFFVRKTISLVKNREYGFQRWYSQMKRLQRYSVIFPSMFPKLLNYGKDKDIAYFDIEYYPEAINAHEYLYHCKESNDIDHFFNALVKTMSELHIHDMVSSKGAMALYINEEIEQRLNDCRKNNQFLNFSNYDEILFNGQKVKSFIKSLNEYKNMCINSFKNPRESFTHGNMTLENILYIPNEKRIILIDPYEENVIDSNLAELSQLLQSSNSKYEIYNSLKARVDRNIVTLKINFNYGIDYFNQRLLKHIKEKYTFDEYIIIRLLEISQFIRMLPFKMEIEPNKMYFFYGLASMLFEDLKKEYIRKKE